MRDQLKQKLNAVGTLLTENKSSFRAKENVFHILALSHVRWFDRVTRHQAMNREVRARTVCNMTTGSYFEFSVCKRFNVLTRSCS